MKKILKTSLFLCVATTAVAENNYIELRGVNPINNDVSTTYHSTEASRLTSGSGESTSEEFHHGFAIGKRFGKFGVALALEENDTDTKIASASGTGVFAAGGTNATVPLEIESKIIELSYYEPINDKTEVFGLFGIGQADLETANSSSIVLSGTTTTFTGVGKKVDDTVMRFGVGAAYQLNDKVSLTGAFIRTDYGTAETTNSSTAVNPNATDLKSDIEEDQLIFAVRYHF